MHSDEASPSVRLQLDLSRRFAAAMMSGPDFDRAFLRARGPDWGVTSDVMGEVLDEIFYGVDDYVADDSLREPEKGDLDEEQLREIVRTQLRRLDEA